MITLNDKYTKREGTAFMSGLHALVRLPMMQRQVITLVDIAGFSYVEIAEILDIPIGTVMSRINRARRKLREKLAEYDPHMEPVKPRLRRVK